MFTEEGLAQCMPYMQQNSKQQPEFHMYASAYFSMPISTTLPASFKPNAQQLKLMDHTITQTNNVKAEFNKKFCQWLEVNKPLTTRNPYTLQEMIMVLNGQVIILEWREVLHYLEEKN